MRLRERERQILVRSLRNPAAEEHRDLPSGDPQTWERVFHAAAQLGVAPLLYVRLKTSKLESAVPTAVLKRHKGDFLWSQARNMKVFARLREVLAVFRAHRIDVIALKGAALAERVYRQIGLRTMGDIDLLVRKDDLARVETIVEEMGFQADEWYGTKEWYRTQHHHLAPYVSSDGILKLEIHHDITTVSSSIRVPVEGLWTRAQMVRIATVGCLTLSWEHTLLHLALHMADENGFLGDLRGLCDVAEIVRRFPGGIDWDELVRVARTWGCVRQLFFALTLAHDAVGAAVPPQVIGQLRRQVSLLPLEERLLRFLCLRAALIFERRQHVVYDWVLLDLVGGLLPGHSRIEVMRGVTHGVRSRVRRCLALGLRAAAVDSRSPQR